MNPDVVAARLDSARRNASRRGCSAVDDATRIVDALDFTVIGNSALALGAA